MTPFKRFSASIVLLALGATLSAGENWPQWRGPGSQGISSEAALPTEWSSVKNIVWKTALPAGHSSPIVWENRIFLTAAIEGEVVPGAKAVNHTVDGQVWLHPDSVAADKKQTLKLLSLDAGSGKVLWERTAYEGVVYDARHRRSSFAGPTAATDGTMVFAYFGPEGLYAYDFSGRLAWKVVERFKTLGLGTGTSPVLYRNLVIIQRDEDEGKESVIAAYDKATGKEAWKTRRPVQISWSTPALVPVPAGTELVTNGSEFAIGYDPATGRELWRTTGVESNAIHTPLVGKGLVIMTAGYPAKKVIAIRPGTVPGDRRVAWQYAKGTGYVLSNIFYGDYVYLLTDNGVVTCLDAETGAVKYEGGRPATPSRFTASPVAYNGVIAMTSEDGETFMLKAGPEHTIVRTNTLDEPVYSSPAIAGGRIYIRGERHLFAIGAVAR
jgi:outer membrane protein assembly factor BamB